MIAITKAMSLMSFADSYTVKTRAQLFQGEFNWISATIGGMPSQALLIPYAYSGSNYPGFFSDLSGIFSSAGVNLTDIGSGQPDVLIGSAQAFVVCGGDIIKLVNKLTGLGTGTFNAFNAIRNRINAGIPYIGWNEGGAVISPNYFKPPATILTPGINASPFQIIPNYNNPAQDRNSVKSFLLNNPSIIKAIAMTDTSHGGSVRLEDSGSGIIDSSPIIYPSIIRYSIVGGNLVES